VLPVSVGLGGAVPHTEPVQATYRVAPGQVAAVLEVTATLPEYVVPYYTWLQVQVGDFVSDGVNIAVQ